jgi:membrane protease YdiL (CAAX protease family)
VHFAAAALLLGILPVAAARVLTGLSLKELGLGLGNVRAGLLLLGAGAPLAILAGAIAAASPAMRAVYPLFPAAARQGFVTYAVVQFLYFGAWEVLFRGVLLFGLRPKLGDGSANALQTALSVTAHFGRAINETASALMAGPLFGWLDLKLGSIWYVAILHWLVGVSMDWFILH